MKTSPARLSACAAVIALASAAPAAAGPYYEVVGPGLGSGHSSAWTVSRSGDELFLSAPAGLATVGPKWWQDWDDCGRGGSIVHSVRWTARRTDARISAGTVFQVNDQAGRVQRTANLRDGLPPWQYVPFEVPVGLGCRVQLRLEQWAQAEEPVRAFWIASPRAVFQDVAPPTATLTAVGPSGPSGWIRAGQDALSVSWSASDNFGSAGIAEQRIQVAGIPKWAGRPGQGAHGVTVDLGGVPDGVHSVRLEVDGDGTASAAHEVPIRVDRTPPLARDLSVAYPGAPGVASFQWFAVDPSGSGLQNTEVQVNSAGDGSTTGQWLTVAASGVSGPASLPDVRVAGVVGDGVHTWRVIARDVAGNAAVVGADAPVIVDTTPPTVDLSPLPGGYRSSLDVDLRVHDNLERMLGIGRLEVEANAAPDGTETGPWVPLADAPGAPGRTILGVPLTPLADGAHVLRVRARNGGAFGAALAGVASGVVQVDHTSPVLPEPPSFERRSPGSVTVTWVAHDPLAGVARAALEFRDGTTWRVLAEAPAANGAGMLTADTSSLPEGATALRLVVADAAGNRATATATLGLDRTPPSIRSLLLSGGPPWSLSWIQSDGFGDLGSCATVVRVSGPGTDYGWRTLLSRPMGEGAQEVVLPVDGLAPGAYRVGVVVCDAAGNASSAETAGLVVAPRAAGTAGRPVAGGDAGGAGRDRLRAARLSLTLDGARPRRVGGQIVLVRRARYGAVLLLSGALRDSEGRAMAHESVEVRSRRGRVIGRARTGSDGRFRLLLRPVEGGRLRIGVPFAGELLPRQADVGVEVRLVPEVSLRTSSRQAVALGAPVVLTGRLAPSPYRAGVPSKAIVLEWRDPTRGIWRPVLNAAAGPDGRFCVRWRFQTRGLRVPLRVRVPRERGWPYESAQSAVVAVEVR